MPPPSDAAYGRFDPLAPEPAKSRRGLAIGATVGALALVAIAVAVILAGNNNVDAQATIKTTTEPTAGLGTLVHSHGITIDLPPNWTNLPTSAAELKAMAARLEQSNPAAARSIAQLSTSELVDHFAVLAVRARADPNAPLEDLDVVVAAAGGMGLDALSLETKTQLAAAGASDVTESSATVGSLPAFKVAYTLTLKTATGTQSVPAEVVGVISGDNFAEFAIYNPGDGVEAQDILDSLTFG